MFGFWGESSRKLGMSSLRRPSFGEDSMLPLQLKVLYPFFIFNYYCA
jgi:hypothetical protein